MIKVMIVDDHPVVRNGLEAMLSAEEDMEVVAAVDGGESAAAWCAANPQSLPDIVVSALSVALYGMFLAIIVPPARKHPAILIGVLVSFALSFLASRLPGIRDLSSGIRIIILTVVVTSALALIRPVSDRELSGEEEEKNKKTEDRDHA